MNEMTASNVSAGRPGRRLSYLGGVATYFVAIASLFPVVLWLHRFWTFNHYHFLTQANQRGPSRRTEIFVFVSQGWWIPAIGMILGSLGRGLARSRP